MLMGRGACSALPAERLISNAALAGSTPKASPAVYSASSAPALNPVLSQTVALPSDVPMELSKLRVEHTPCTPEVARVGLTAPAACTPSGGCDDEHPQAHLGIRV
jgi:hypothetical protein